MNIGIFSPDNENYTGNISTFGAQFANVSFERITSQGAGPDYIITTDGGELGAAWEKTSDNGTYYLSVSLSGPFTPKVNCALLESKKTPGNWSLVWNPPKAVQPLDFTKD